MLQARLVASILETHLRCGIPITNTHGASEIARFVYGLPGEPDLHNMLYAAIAFSIPVPDRYYHAYTAMRRDCANFSQTFKFNEMLDAKLADNIYLRREDTNTHIFMCIKVTDPLPYVVTGN